MATITDVTNQSGWTARDGVPGRLYRSGDVVYAVVILPGNRFTVEEDEAATAMVQEVYNKTGVYPDNTNPAFSGTSGGGTTSGGTTSGGTSGGGGNNFGGGNTSGGINTAGAYGLNAGNQNMRNNPWSGWTGDWAGSANYSPVFGEYSPAQQYESIMSTAMPNYYTPGYQQMAQRQFQPTFGRFLLGGYGAGGTGTAEEQQQRYMQTFGDWYTPQQMQQGGTPTDISQGWNLATQLSAMQPGSESYYQAALDRDALPLAMSLQNEDDVRAMALARYYGGQTPGSSYAARQTASALGNLYNRWSQRAIQEGQGAPSQFISYLGDLNQDRFGAYA